MEENNYHRYIEIKALKLANNELVPFWFLKHVVVDEYDCEIEKYEYQGVEYNNFLTDCTWDLKEQRIVEAIQVEARPTKTDFHIDEVVMVEVPYSVNQIHRQLRKDRIYNIKFDEFDIQYYKGTEVMDWIFKDHKTSIQPNEVDPKMLYAFKIYKPHYILSNGEVIDYDFKLHRILEENGN